MVSRSSSFVLFSSLVSTEKKSLPAAKYRQITRLGITLGFIQLMNLVPSGGKKENCSWRKQILRRRESHLPQAPDKVICLSLNKHFGGRFCEQGCSAHF